jgi:hypothetical protein
VHRIASDEGSILVSGSKVSFKFSVQINTIAVVVAERSIQALVGWWRHGRVERDIIGDGDLCRGKREGVEIPMCGGVQAVKTESLSSKRVPNFPASSYLIDGVGKCDADHEHESGVILSSFLYPQQNISMLNTASWRIRANELKFANGC